MRIPASTQFYEVEFADGTVEQAYTTANTITQNIYTQVDNYGHQEAILDEIVDHEFTSSAITREQAAALPSKRHVACF